MLTRFSRWWLGRPHHKIRVYTPTAKKWETLSFTDDEWGSMLLMMGSIGCTSVPEAVARAIEIADHVDDEHEHLEPSPPEDAVFPEGYGGYL